MTLESPATIDHRDVPALVRRLWSEVLELDTAEPGDDFFSCGGHSLSAVALISALDTALNIEVDMDILFDVGTLEGLTTECLRLLDALPE